MNIKPTKKFDVKQEKDPQLGVLVLPSATPIRLTTTVCCGITWKDGVKSFQVGNKDVNEEELKKHYSEVNHERKN